MRGMVGDASAVAGAVIVAAGAGRRLGGVAKALLQHRGRSYLETVVTTARAVGVVDAVVVVGAPFGDVVAAHARQLGLRVRVNPAPERGMASSVALGFAAISAGPAALAWLWPVDHPAVQASTLRALQRAIGDADVAQPRYAGRGGHPPLVARALWSRLAGCVDARGLPPGGSEIEWPSGSIAQAEGARGVLRAARSVGVDVDDPGVVRDVDTPADLEMHA